MVSQFFSRLCSGFIMAMIMTCFSSLTMKAEKKDPLQGLNINVLGDSYVANHRRPKEETWHAKIADRHQMEYHSYGRNGGCIAFDRTQEGFGPSMMVRYKDMNPDADIILIIAGHNDAVKIKNSTDSLQCFTDSLDVLLDRIQQKWPQARIGYVTPWYLDKEGFEPTIKAIRKVCRRHRVPVLDNYSAKSVIQVRDPEFRKQYFQNPGDTAHLNDLGHNLFYPIGEAFLLKLVR